MEKPRREFRRGILELSESPSLCETFPPVYGILPQRGNNGRVPIVIADGLTILVSLTSVTRFPFHFRHGDATDCLASAGAFRSARPGSDERRAACNRQSQADICRTINPLCDCGKVAGMADHFPNFGGKLAINLPERRFRDS